MGWIKSNLGPWVKNEPMVNDEGIFIPIHPYTLEGEATAYQMIMSKEMFQEAYRRFIIREGKGKGKGKDNV